MKVSGFCAVFLMVVTVTAFAFFSLSSTTGPSWFPDLVGRKCVDETTPTAISRKLKENVSNMKSNVKGDKDEDKDKDRVSLEDYNPVDPTPGDDRKNVQPGPIEHGTPLMPFIPISPPPAPSPGDY
ncbi:uncharacterized protein LOC131594135 [Vicia villosa]|uniref:uncharacterized protein LOC131594135 n=1 Tax=Vicia villosa TaxID=3911 RepID=UPI00273CA05B|nr:uncharacterized protein LOC131594135 [Vicia villosa]